MARKRLKHKDVLETIEQDDLLVIKEKAKAFWNNRVRPYEGTIWTALVAIVVLVGGYYWWSGSNQVKLEDANYYLASAKSKFDSGFSDTAQDDLNYVLPGGSQDFRSISVPARMVQANIACASGDYETAISILTGLSSDAPKDIRADIRYQLATALEDSGDLEAALDTLDEIRDSLSEEPEEDNYTRATSPWDRFYFRRGRVLKKLNRIEESQEYLLRVHPKSPWVNRARLELAWIKGVPVNPLPMKWSEP